MLNYKQVGSVSKSFEGKGLQAPNFKWLGLRAAQIASLLLSPEVFEPLTRNDIKKVDAMLGSSLYEDYHAELNHMKQGKLHFSS